ncbi:unnamed protein product [Choristocarpus tenellus]
MQMSRNHYHLSWSLKTHRRIKNVIVLLDWTPDTTQLRPVTGATEGKVVSGEQETLLKKAFSLLDFDGDTRLGEEEFQDLLRALDVDVDNPSTGRATVVNIARAAGVTTPLVTFEQVRELMRTQAYVQIQKDRFLVALSLSEAENLRGAIHICGRTAPLVPGLPTAVGLRLANGTVFDTSLGYVKPLPYQLGIQEQCFRFLDSETKYQDRELDLLLRGVQDNEKYLREAWFVDVRACRRRQQVPVGRTPVARIFRIPDEFHLLHHRATISAVRKRIKAKGLLVRDAFLAFNSSRSGALSCSEMYGALEWLGLRVGPSEVQDVVRTIDLDVDGYVSWDEFKCAFHEPDKDEAMGVADTTLVGGADWPDFEGGVTFTVKPKPMQELYDNKEEKAKQKQYVENISGERLEAFKLKVHKQERLERIWTTHGTASRTKCSVWVPTGLQLGPLHRNKERLCFGHFSRAGLSGWGRKDADVEPQILEITDTGKWRMRHGRKLDSVIDTLFPKPKRFREVWKQVGGDKELYVWRPVPPSNLFVSMGMVVTNSEEAPPSDSVRCLPRRWVVESKFTPVKVWDDSGTEGRAGALWVVNKLHLMAASVGHELPQGPFWDLKEDRFFISPEEFNELDAVPPSGTSLSGSAHNAGSSGHKGNGGSAVF